MSYLLFDSRIWVDRSKFYSCETTGNQGENQSSLRGVGRRWQGLGTGQSSLGWGCCTYRREVWEVIGWDLLVFQVF